MLLAATLQRPWGYCFSELGKPVENRTWSPPESLIDQWIAIHAGKTLDDESLHQLRVGGLRIPDDGGPEGIVAVARYVGCVTGEYGAVRFPEGRRGDIVRKAFEGRGEQWFFGPIGWVFEEVVPIDPVPCRGMQKLWVVPPEPLAVVRMRFGESRARRAS